ncbi:MAG TPA: hypothetical protein DCR40_02485 [Prolixibacteraceae bacterium]|nr:hypothetical protein [Prolixibacteraceae bacterium]
MKTKFLLRLKNVLLLPLLFLLFTAMSTIGMAQTVNVTTDKDDYYPGEWVIITGSGWQDDANVQLTLTHLDPLPDPLHAHESWLVQPNAEGYIYYEWYVDTMELGTSFDLTALGMTTGLTATTYFTDAATKDTYPSAFSTFTGGSTYCQGATPTNLSVSWTTTNCGTAGSSVNIPITIKWFNTSSGTAVSTINTNAGTTTSSYTPPTTVSGTLNYYVVVSWNAGTNCAPAGSITSGTQAVIVNAPPTTANAGTDQTICIADVSAILAANTPSVGAGIWSVVSGPSSSLAQFSSTTNPAATFTPAGGAGVYTLTWTISNAPCTASADNVAITFNAVPTIANAGPDQTVCAATATLAGNTATTGTGTWTLVSGTGTITTPGSPTSGVTGLGVGANTFRWTISNSPCTASSDEVVITRNASPTTSNAGPDQTICIADVSATLAANTPYVGAGVWSVVSGPSLLATQFNSTTNQAATFTPAGGAGVYTLRWTITNAPCTASTDDVVISFKGNPTTANAGPDQTEATTCGLTQVTLAANAPSVGTGAWSIVSGAGGSFGNAASPTSTFTGTAGATYTLKWTISNSPCTEFTDLVDITFNKNPTTAAAGPDQTGAATCGLTQVTLAANTPTVGTGAWSIVSGAGGSFVDASSPTSTFSGTAGTTYTLRWTITNSPCTASTDDVVVKFNQNPTVADAGPDQTDAATCGLTTVTLTANTPTIGTGSWSKISGSGGSFSDASSPSSTFSGSAGNTYTLRWTISNSPCTASTDDVVITFNENPTIANAGSDQTGASTCGLTTVALSANNPTKGTGQWSVVSGTGGSFSNASSRTSDFTGVAGSEYTLRWTITNGPCISTDDVIIKFNQNPITANADGDQIICTTTGSATLAANTPSIGTGAWSVVSGPSLSASQFSSTTNPAATFTPAGGAGVYTLRWTISNAPCTASTDDVLITVKAPPTVANAGSDQTGLTTCGLTTVTLAANTPTVGTGAWSIVTGAGGSFGNVASPTSTFSGTAGTTYTLKWTISNSPCTESTDLVDITFNRNPTAANAGTDQTGAATCGITQVTLAANTPTVGTGAWSIVSGADGSFGDASSPTSTFSGTAGVSYTLRWTITNSPCTASTDDVVIKFNQNPTVADAGPDQTGAATCGTTQVTLAANTPSIGTGSWSVVSGAGGSFGTASSPTSTFSGTAGTTYTLRWTISNAPCTASTDDVVIKFNQNPTTANAGSDQTGLTTCGLTTVTLAANTPTVGTGAWSIVSGAGGSFGNTASPTSTFTGTAGTTYTLKWTISNSPCTESTDVVDITFNINPTTATAGPDQTGAATCGLTTVTLAANAPTVGTGAWSIVSGAGGSFGDAASPTSTFSGTAGITYTLRWTITNSPCTASTDDVVIKFNQNPTASNAGPDQTLCLSTAATLAANAPLIGTGAWSIVSAPSMLLSQFSSTTNRNATFTPADGPGTYKLRWTISNNPCIASTDDVDLIYNPRPTGVISGTTSICAGSNATLRIDVTGTGPWSGTINNDGSFSGTTSPIYVTVSPSANTTYTIATLSDKNCIANAGDKTGSATVTVNALPIATIKPSSQIVCYNAFGGIGASGTGGASVTISYSLDGVNTLTDTKTLNGPGTNLLGGDFIVGPITANTTVTLISTSLNGCSTISPQPSVTITLETTLPTWTTVAGALDRTVECSDATALANAQALVPAATDNCPGTLVPVKTAGSFVAGSCPQAGTYTNTWVVTDAAGNEVISAFTQVITIEDTTNPVIDNTAKANLTVECDGAGNTAAITTWLAANAGATAGDACSSVTWSNDYTGLSDGCGATGTATVIFTATDACANSSTTTATVTIVDTTNPVIDNTAKANLTVECDGAGNTAAIATWLAANAGATAGDACSSVTWSNDYTGLSDGCGATGKALVTFTATDACNNTSTTTANVTIVDTKAPDITVPANITVTFNPSVCGTLVNYTAVSALDNCSGVVTPVRTVGPASGSIFPIGTTTVTHTATDLCGNLSSKSFTVTVNPLSVTPVLTVTPVTQQYSDKVEFKVVIPNGVSTCGNAATSATFTVTNGGSQTMGTANFVANGTSLEATLNAALFEIPSSNVMAPGAKTVSVVINVPNTSTYTVGSPNTTPLTITQEDARVTFTGTTMVATPSATATTAPIVTLRATIQDVSATTDAAGDIDFGNISKAKVRFLNNNVPIVVSGLTDVSGWVLSGISLVNSADIKTGVVSLNWANVSEGQYTIGIEVGSTGYYIRNNQGDDAVVNVYQPVGDFITGGGYIINPSNTAGTYAGTPGLKTNFGFNVKYNKTGKNLQGNMNFIFRRLVSGVVRTYQIKSNAMTSLGVDISNLAAQKAVFVSKANLTDITNPLAPVSLGGGLVMQVNMTDKGEPGSSDQIAISLYDGSTLLFSNNWTGTSTAELVLGGGNLVVKSGYSITISGTNKSAEIATEVPVVTVQPTLKTYPNPFTERVNIEFSYMTDTHARLEIYNIAGSKLETLYDGPINGGEQYHFEYVPNLVSSQMVIYRLTMNGETRVGKMIYQERR